LVDSSAIPLIVLSRQQDAVEIINSTLRNAGHPVHCTWIRETSDLAEALQEAKPELLFCCLPDLEDAAACMEIRDRYATTVPTLLVREAVTEDELNKAFELGAQDVVTLQASKRLQVVASRELRAARLDHALAGTLASAHEYRDQMKAFMSGSADAIAHVQEGIIVDVNPAWTELLGQQDPTVLLGQPLMDCFDVESHTALKGALVASVQGRWAGHALRAAAVLPDQSRLALDLEFERFEIEGEPAVRLKVATQKRDLESLAKQLEDSVRLDSATGLLRRSVFLEQAGAQAAQPVKAGLRNAFYLQLDKTATLELEIGPLALEELVAAVGTQIRDAAQPGDLVTRVSGHGFALLLERGNARDLEAWTSRLLQRIAEHVFRVGNRSFSLTCSVGAAACDAQGEPLHALLDKAVAAQREAVRSGGNRLELSRQAESEAATSDADRHWATQIKSALMANRFRLVQQPIASLVGDDRDMFDLLVRMLDEQGREVLPSEFLAAAERTDLLKNIDRWVVGAAMSFCAARKPHRVFVRLSRDSICDPSLGPWLWQQLHASGIDAERMVIEVSEETATQHLMETKELQALAQRIGFGFAIENFGAGRDPVQLLSHVPMNYVKIDGALMQGLANDRRLQEKVRSLADEAKSRSVTTIAQRVEDANTMAVLWQLGIEFIQGYFVNSPEEVVLGN
jgi:EAL domain-containing protein (putative c-di-GMP-specific phosphodiesterase class I)/GGDEF domain-containing protein